MNPGKVCQIEEIYCSQWKLTWCWGRSRSTRWSPSPCRTHTPHSGYLSLLQSLGGAACSGVTTHTHTHTKLSLHSERFSDFQFGFGLIDTNTAMWDGCYRATVQRERELAVVMCTLRLPLHSTAWWRSHAGRSTHLPTHTPAYRGLIFAIRTLSIYSRGSVL